MSTHATGILYPSPSLPTPKAPKRTLTRELWIHAARGRVIDIHTSKEDAKRVQESHQRARQPRTIVRRLANDMFHTDEVAELAYIFGNDFFTPARKRTFQTVVYPVVFGHRFFVTQETVWGRTGYSVRQFRIYPGERRMTVNLVDGQEFMGHATLESAQAEAARLGKLAEKRSEFGVDI